MGGWRGELEVGKTWRKKGRVWMQGGLGEEISVERGEEVG
jgi:hypothetical protein